MVLLTMGGRTRLWCACVVLALVTVTDRPCSASGDIRAAVNSLDVAVRSKIDTFVNYSDATLTCGYNSSTDFDPKGMGTLYNVTHVFMDIVQSGEPFPEGMLYVEDGTPRIDRLPPWQTLLRYYAGTVAVVVVGVLFAVLLPFVGFVFCCCRCAGRCGGRSQPFEKRRDPCRRIFLGVLLSVVTIVILFGVVCAFVTNEYMEKGTQQLPKKAKTGLGDADLYLGNTKLEVDNLLVTNYGELEAVLDDVLRNSGTVVQQQLAQISNATILKNLTNFVDGLEAIQYDLSNISHLTYKLNTDKNKLEDVLEDIKRVLKKNLDNCSGVDSCRKMLDEMRNISAGNVDKLPSINGSLNEVQKLFDSKIKEGVQDGISQFDQVQVDIQQSVNKTIPSVIRNIRSAGKAIEGIASNVTGLLTAVRNSISGLNRAVDESQKYLDDYGKYRYYVGLGVSCALLVILLCLTLGLFYGFCGKRPDEYGADCCTRGTGARFLMVGVYIMFLLSSVLMILTLVHFLVGLAGNKFICEPAQNPSNSQVLSLVDQIFDFHTMLAPSSSKLSANISSIISSCHKNNTIYEVLMLSDIVNISEVTDYKSKYKIDDTINDLKGKVTFNRTVTILQPKVRKDLESLTQKDSELSKIDFKGFSDVLNQSIVNLTSFALELNSTADALPDSVPRDIQQSLRWQSYRLQLTQDDLVSKMTADVEQLKMRTSSLEQNLKFNHSSLNEAVKDLISNTDKVENYLKNDGKKTITKLVDKFFKEFLTYIDQYLSRVVSNTRNKVGQCGPVSKVFNSTVVAVCDQLLNPLDGFWASVGWSLVLFLPAIILSVKLASLYSKSDPYPGPLVESVHDKKSHHRRYDETYDNSSGYMGDYNGHLGRERGRDRGAGSGVHNDARYNDMAPKYTRLGHWDYPNGGPPRYHSSPLSTEYERPPPYYYPGPGDNSRR